MDYQCSNCVQKESKKVGRKRKTESTASDRKKRKDFNTSADDILNDSIASTNANHPSEKPDSNIKLVIKGWPPVVSMTSPNAKNKEQQHSETQLVGITQESAAIESVHNDAEESVANSVSNSTSLGDMSIHTLDDDGTHRARLASDQEMLTSSNVASSFPSALVESTPQASYEAFKSKPVIKQTPQVSRPPLVPVSPTVPIVTEEPAKPIPNQTRTAQLESQLQGQ